VRGRIQAALAAERAAASTRREDQDYTPPAKVAVRAQPR
jgi:hypothetical protein